MFELVVIACLSLNPDEGCKTFKFPSMDALDLPFKCFTKAQEVIVKEIPLTYKVSKYKCIVNNKDYAKI